MYLIDNIIDYSIKCPELGKKLGAYGCVEDLEHIPDTAWYIVRIQKKIRIIGYSRIEERQMKKRKHFILSLKTQPKAHTMYEHVNLYEARAFRMEIEPKMQNLEFDSIKKVWDGGLYICENDEKVYYIIIG